MRFTCLLACALPLCAASYDTDLARAFGSQAGSAVVLDVATGRILGGFQLDKARTRKAAPGSTLKPFTWLAWSGEHKGAAIPRMVCRRKLTAAGHTLDCAHPDAAIPLGPSEALAYSCNSFFDQLRFAPPPSFLQRYGFTAYAAQNLTLGAIGEEGLKVTPLELAKAYRQLALQAAKRTLDGHVANGLAGSVQYGSGQLAGIKGLAVAGKTGTTAGPSRTYTHAWFAGWAPADKPEIVVVVFLEQGRGASNAAPLAGAAFQALRGAAPESAVSTARSLGGNTVRISLYSELKPESLTVNGKTFTAAALTKPLRYTRPTLAAPGTKPVPIPATVEISARAGRVHTVAEMRLEDYVYYTLSGEAHSMRQREALRAMAIAARTFAVKNRGRHSGQGFDYCDTTHCQDIRFAEPPRAIAQAVEDTEAELVWFEGRPAEVFYHQHCGGVTASAKAVWGAAAPYLISQTDDACIARKRGAWSTRVPKSAAARALGLSSLDSLRVAAREHSGRANFLQTASARIEASDFRFLLSRAFGWTTVPSTLFQLTDEGDTLRLQGYGSGHGVGMCQTGAEARAERGATARQILSFYFPGTRTGVSAQGIAWSVLGGERVELWSTKPAEDKPLVALADRALLRAEGLTGTPLAQRPRLRVYPSVELYRDATGQPGMVAAATRGLVVRMQPASVLQSRGVLESTLLHELTHVALEARAKPGLPDWFLEGLTLALTHTAGTRRYEAVQQRVEELIVRYGKTVVLGWVQQGLPAGVKQ